MTFRRGRRAAGTTLRAAAGVAALAAVIGCGSGADSGSGAPDQGAEAGKSARQKSEGVDRKALQKRAAAIFGPLPEAVPSPDNPFSQEKIKLGRMLYYDARLSKNHDISCNSCHQLDRYGVDGEPTSPGHGGVRGERNSPTVYNAALHIAQFWDGRAADLEEQAKGPVMNPVEMGMPSEDYVIRVLGSIPGYVKLFHAAFPNGDEDVVTFDNMARAIAAFERKLMTPGSFDAFLEGDVNALTEAQLEGLRTFIDTGCVTCHQGPAVGGGMFQKLGLVKPYGTADPGRFAVTGKESDRGVFKVPSLRNVAQTAPYFHDGSIGSLEEAIRLMGEHQLGVSLSDGQVRSIRTFLNALTGRIDPIYTARPELPKSGPDTPEPDPT